jgi:hypothetical protein
MVKRGTAGPVSSVYDIEGVLGTSLSAAASPRLLDLSLFHMRIACRGVLIFRTIWS